MLPSSTSVRFLFHPALPETRSCTSGYGLRWVVCDGCGAPAVRGNRLLEEGREGLRPDTRPRARAKSATVTTWGATTNEILALREHLVAAKVSCVVIESTSDYWKPFVRHEALEIEWG